MPLTTFLKKLSPGRIIALGFLFCILLGSLLLILPCSLQTGIALPYLDALYTATSAVCVTGLNVIDPGSTFSPFGQFVLGCLIQIGGLGVASIGVGIMLAMGKKINLKERRVIRDAMNLDSGKGLIRFVKAIFCTTLLIELLGAFLSFPVFFRDYPLPRAIGLSLFHSVASFNNSGFDVLGNGTSLIPYQKDVFLNLVTCALVIAGGIGFPVIFELPLKHFSWKRQSMHTRVVLSTTFALLLFGTLLLKLTESISWLGAFFYSVSARTAGFSTYNLSDFSTAGLLVVSGLMFIGASPASTGGGIKTTTFFVLLSGIYSAATNHSERAFHSAIPKDAFRKASVISMLAVFLVMTASYLMLIFDPQLSLRDVLFEMISAFSTSGLSTGITPQLSAQSRILSIIMMYIGRLGPLTVASLWYFTIGERVRYPEGTIAIG